jgi:hypothetical protein
LGISSPVKECSSVTIKERRLVMTVSIGQGAKDVIVNRKKQLKESIAAQASVNELPIAIIDYPADSCYVGYDTRAEAAIVTMYFYGEGREERAKELLSMLVESGAVLEQEVLKDRTFYSKPTETSMSCILCGIRITVKGLPLPSNCEIEEIDSPGKIYKVICTGKGGAG